MSSSISKKGLGRGLSSLMGDTKDVSIQNETLNQETKIREQLNILYDLIVLILMFIVIIK